ncbi:DUF4390 domain-containing protein [Methylotenera sp.]|uniref:DUF4390 domain-containing protein n=1 Tax=Methylotenera mobilis TaxID=359408 RepID=A0A351RC41_9PROT|nr:DUF4390 domain-containing protein [Methylotenera sp.]MDP3777732.1 DUF4390 domain-containing protein [Methylotenera sp.]PPD43409.1 MAG: hypothetical protein CTY14_08730 [Methylotenera sp.]HBA09612.1 DUF4390 domain-containing protein [Methylotenera mobilis]
MHYCKKIKVIFCVVALVLFSSSVLAEGSSLRLRSANLTVYEDDYLLNADAEINFGSEIEKAILKGFVFNFLIEFQLLTPKKYWFDDEVATVVQHVSLSYHALTRQYIVMRNDQQRAYATLDEALEDLSIIQDMKVFQEADVEKGERYQAVLLMRLDQKKLPKALQIEGMTSSEWKISSQRFEWTPNLFK